MTHEEIKILVSSYADGEVTASEKTIVEEHLASCRECQKDLAAFRKLSSSLKKWPDERLSPDVEMKIARQGATKERPMEKQEVAVQWSGVVAVIAVLGLSLWGVQYYGQHQMQARVSDASRYSLAGAQGQSETFSLSKVVARKNPEGRLKSSTDDIGDQFTPGYSSYVQATVAQPVGSKQDKNERPVQLAALAAPAKDKAMPSTTQYEPNYLQSNYEIVREESEIIGLDRDRRLSSAQQSAVYAPASPVAGLYMRDEGMITPQPRVYNYPQPIDNETYEASPESGFMPPEASPLSTFSIDVDTASYSNIRRFLNQGQLPPQDAVRIEEIVNYFSYDYPEPMWGQPFSITTEVAPCPWNPSHQLALIGLQGKRLNGMAMPASNLVFLIDVSGSMNSANKLPLLQDAFRMMTHELEGKDKVSIIVYAGAAGLVLDATPGNYKERILSAIDQLQAGGSTAGGDGIRLAYQVARNNFIANGNNRVILATDGDFNVGISSDNELVRMIEDYRDQGIFLTVLGFGDGNLKDAKMEKLADKGNGNYFYIDTQNEARKVLVHELGSTLFTIAKDVKIQVEFNPATVKAYRLIGYENRMLAKEDFNDDTKDAGELGAGHTVTALYEIIPTGSYEQVSGQVDPLRYQKAPQVIRGGSSDVMTVKLRYKDPKGTTSKLIQKVVGKNDVQAYAKSDNFRFASAAAEFGLLLRQSPYRGSASFEHVLNQARSAKGDEFGYRQEFTALVEQARALSPHVMPLPMDDERPLYPVYKTPNQGKSQK